MMEGRRIEGCAGRAPPDWAWAHAAAKTRAAMAARQIVFLQSRQYNIILLLIIQGTLRSMGGGESMNNFSI
jgi:hypothetical protein